MKIAVIYSQYYQEVWNGQKKQIEEFAAEKSIDLDYFEIPGSMEAPYMSAKVIKEASFDGIVVLGCVVEGETYHNHIIQNCAHDHLIRLSVDNLMPMGIGILTVKNYEQALYRSSDKKPYARHAIKAVYDLLTT